MPLSAFRATKIRYAVFDGEGARRAGGRWHSVGRPLIYASTCLAGALLDIVIHLGQVRLPGPHHAAVAEIPDAVAHETLTPKALRGWDQLPDAPAARGYGDRRLAEARTAVLIVPRRPLDRCSSTSCSTLPIPTSPGSSFSRPRPSCGTRGCSPEREDHVRLLPSHNGMPAEADIPLWYPVATPR